MPVCEATLEVLMEGSLGILESSLIRRPGHPFREDQKEDPQEALGFGAAVLVSLNLPGRPLRGSGSKVDVWKIRFGRKTRESRFCLRRPYHVVCVCV